MRDTLNSAVSPSDRGLSTATIEITGSSGGAARVTVTVYVCLVVPSSAVTVIAIVFSPSARLTSGPGAIDSSAPAWLAAAVTVVVSTALSTLAVYNVTALENVPISMPDRLSPLSVASRDTDRIVRVDVPSVSPACLAAIETASASSVPASTSAVTVVVAELAPGGSDSVSDDTA